MTSSVVEPLRPRLLSEDEEHAYAHRLAPRRAWESIPSRRLPARELDRQYDKCVRANAAMDRIKEMLDMFSLEAQAHQIRQQSKEKARLEGLLAEDAAWEYRQQQIKEPPVEECVPSAPSGPYFRPYPLKKKYATHSIQTPTSTPAPTLVRGSGARPPLHSHHNSHMTASRVSSSSSAIITSRTIASESQLRQSVQESVASLMKTDSRLNTHRSMETTLFEEDPITPYRRGGEISMDRSLEVLSEISDARTLRKVQNAVRRVQGAQEEHLALQRRVVEAMEELPSPGSALPPNLALTDRIAQAREHVRYLEGLAKDVENKRRKAARLSEKLAGVLARLKDEGVEEDLGSEGNPSEDVADDIASSAFDDAANASVVSDIYTANTSSTEIVPRQPAMPHGSPRVFSAKDSSHRSSPVYVVARTSSSSSSGMRRSLTPSSYIPPDPDSREDTSGHPTIYPYTDTSATDPTQLPPPLPPTEWEFYQHDSEVSSPRRRRSHRARKVPTAYYPFQPFLGLLRLDSVVGKGIKLEEPRWAYDAEELRVPPTPEVSMVDYVEAGVDASCIGLEDAVQTAAVVCTTSVIQQAHLLEVDEPPPPAEGNAPKASYLMTLQGMSEWRRAQLQLVTAMASVEGLQEEDVERSFDVVEAHIARSLFQKREKEDEGEEGTTTSPSSASARSPQRNRKWWRRGVLGEKKKGTQGDSPPPISEKDPGEGSSDDAIGTEDDTWDEDRSTTPTDSTNSSSVDSGYDAQPL